MRTITLLAIAALLALVLVPSPAAASHHPLFFTKDYAWSGVGYKKVDTFNVPATNATWKYLCYQRSYFSQFAESSTLRVTLKDSTGKVIVSDTGATVGVLGIAVPIGGPGVVNPYTRGLFTLTFEGDGVSGFSRIRVYGVLNQADCGKYLH